MAYILDGDSLSKFLTYFGGMTIKVPELRELRLVVQALLLYQYVNLEKGDFDDALKVLSDEFTEQEIKNMYNKVVEVVENYEFHRD